MELAAAYTSILEDKMIAYNREFGLDGDWTAFHESSAHTVSVFAGRQTGKTTNLALRAFNSKHDCIIYTTLGNEIPILINMLRGLAEENNIRHTVVSSNEVSGIFRMSNNKTISIENIGRVRSYLPHRANSDQNRWIDKEIFFSEFDHNYFCSFISSMESQVNQAVSIRSVSSIRIPSPTISKEWFKNSDVHYFIDNENSHYTVNDNTPMAFEHQPSTAREMIDNMEPRRPLPQVMWR
jgi:hypothetical protein